MENLSNNKKYFTYNRFNIKNINFLENQFIKKNLLPQMIEEIRQFYRFSQTEKISHIYRSAFYH